uniref:Transmembrane protein n=1 Tax=Rhizochromulina marina TaxID=1034831 RepID=A0A7S2RLV3_9STRA
MGEKRKRRSMLEWLLDKLTLVGSVLSADTVLPGHVSSREGQHRQSNPMLTYPAFASLPNTQAVLAKQVFAAKYLVSVFILDFIALGVGRMALAETVLLAHRIGYSIVFTTVVLTSIETAIEFVSSAAVPRIYAWVFDDSHISSRNLTHLAVKAYLLSAVLAVCFYPIMGVVTQLAGIRNSTSFFVLAVMQAMQYPLINQIGDQALEMALPHWMETFNGLWLVAPGRPVATSLGCCYGCCCSNAADEEPSSAASFAPGNVVVATSDGECAPRGPSMEPLPPKGTPTEPKEQPSPALESSRTRKSPWRRHEVVRTWGKNLIAKASPDSLAYFLNLVKFVMFSIFAIVFIVCGNNAFLRWAVIIVLSAISLSSAVIMHTYFDEVAPYIVEERAAPEQTSTRWLHQMQGSESSLVWFMTVIFSVPSDASSAVLAVLYVVISTGPATAFVVVGGLLVLVYLCRLIRQAGEEEETETFEESPRQSESKQPQASFLTFIDGSGPRFETWLRQYSLIIVFLSLAALGLYLSTSHLVNGTGLFYFSGVCLVPYFALNNSLKSRVDAALFDYSEQEGYDLIYWRNILNVALKAPVLIADWYVLQLLRRRHSGLDDDESEEKFQIREGSVVLAVTVAILLINLLYYSVVDRRLPAKHSAADLVNRTERQFQLRAASHRSRMDSVQMVPRLSHGDDFSSEAKTSL